MSDKMCNECKRCDGDLCTYFDNYSDRESTIACILFEPKKQTVFDYITQSEEKLVELLVCQIDTTKKKLIVLPEIEEQLYVETTWKSTLTGAFYATKNEAVEATLAELRKEVGE